jgi:hypothetical protein
MMANLLPSIFTIEIGGAPTLVFEAQNLREALELWGSSWRSPWARRPHN